MVSFIIFREVCATTKYVNMKKKRFMKIFSIWNFLFFCSQLFFWKNVSIKKKKHKMYKVVKKNTQNWGSLRRSEHKFRRIWTMRQMDLNYKLGVFIESLFKNLFYLVCSLGIYCFEKYMQKKKIIQNVWSIKYPNFLNLFKYHMKWLTILRQLIMDIYIDRETYFQISFQNFTFRAKRIQIFNFLFHQI